MKTRGASYLPEDSQMGASFLLGGRTEMGQKGDVLKLGQHVLALPGSPHSLMAQKHRLSEPPTVELVMSPA